MDNWNPEIMARFWSYVHIRNDNDCWFWKRGLFTDGYPQFRIGKKKCRGNRVAFVFTYGPIPPEQQALHICDAPSCCNPEHLFLGTACDNATDRERKGRGRKNYGSYNPRARLIESQVVEIRKQYTRVWGSQRALAKRFSVTPSNIGHIIRNQSWTFLLQQKPKDSS